MSNRAVKAEESADRISLHPERTSVCSNAGVFAEPSFSERIGNGCKGQWRDLYLYAVST
jgi:hypothetical protein